MRTRTRRRRQGVSLVEMAITVAIVTILAAVGAGMINETLPTWRARQAAYSYAATLNRARTLAVGDGLEYRVIVTHWDEVPGDGEGAGTWLLQRGNRALESTDWDTLPVELATSSTPLDNEGTFDISPGAPNELPGAAIYQPGLNPPIASGPITATATSSSDTGDIAFLPSGMVSNPAADFICDVDGNGAPDGVVCTVFYNDRAWQKGRYEIFTVVTTRAGLVKVISGSSESLASGGGTPTNTQYGDDGSGSGYANGGMGPTGDGADTGGGASE